MRLVDADALIERLKFKRDKCDIDNKKHAGLDCAIFQINKAPTEDVVLRAEVEELKKENEDLRNVLANTINKYRNCETEVAKQIFEELEKNPVIMQSCIFIDKKQYAELKKKHIGEINE